MADEIKSEPNLTPILDLVFQLITFFMLVTSFKSAEIDMNLKLPVVGSAKPADTDGRLGVMVLNIDKTGNLILYGHAVPNIEGYIRSEAMATMLKNRITADDLAAGEDLPTTVMIRADRSATFQMINRVIKACQDNGYRKFALKALDREA